MVTAVDIANRALQKAGVPAAGRITSFTDDSQAAAAISACYDILRRAELRRNLWSFAIRRAEVVADTDTADLEYTPPTWAAATSYDTGEIVTYSGLYYISTDDANVGQTPTAGGDWDEYLLADAWVAATEYDEGDEVFYRGNYYAAKETSTGAHPATSIGDEWDKIVLVPQASAWSAATTYALGDLVYVGDSFTVYSANQASLNDAPATAPEWTTLVGDGVQDTTPEPPFGRVYAFSKPEGLLRLVPLDPKYPAGPSEVLLEGGQLLSDYPGPVQIRFVYDEEDTTKFDALFVEAFACRIAYEVCEELTQSNTKKSGLASDYTQFVSDARLVDAIERGPTETDEDDWVLVRN